MWVAGGDASALGVSGRGRGCNGGATSGNVGSVTRGVLTVSARGDAVTRSSAHGSRFIGVLNKHTYQKNLKK